MRVLGASKGPGGGAVVGTKVRKGKTKREASLASFDSEPINSDFSISEQCFSNVKVPMNHLEILLKRRVKFSRSGVGSSILRQQTTK